MKTTKIRWLIAHQPVYLFYRVAEDFKNIVNTLSKDHQIDIEILTADEFNAKYNPAEPAAKQNLYKFLQDNTVQIAQMQTTSLARKFNHQMQVLDMPYLFEDHDHAARVLEGPIGQHLLNNFDPASQLKGLAYTYSGGFRVMPFDREVKNLAELAGSRARSGMSPIMQDTMRAFGFDPFPVEIEEVSKHVLSGEIIGGEHTTQRLLPDQCDRWVETIVDTQHSLFLTSIVVNINWWNDLSDELKDIFAQAAFQAARNERDLSIKDGDQSIATLQAKGATYIQPDQEQMAEFKKITAPLYDKFDETYFGSDLVDQIRQQSKLH